MPKRHVTTPDLLTITPFNDRTPRHPVRLFSAEGVSVAVLVSELFVPATAARSFSDALLDCPAAADVGETVDELYDLDVDTGPMKSFAAEVEQHYRDLAQRIEQAASEQRPEDRMYT